MNPLYQPRLETGLQQRRASSSLIEMRCIHPDGPNEILLSGLLLHEGGRDLVYKVKQDWKSDSCVAMSDQ